MPETPADDLSRSRRYDRFRLPLENKTLRLNVEQPDDEMARLRRIERAARALLDGVTWQAAVEPSHPAVGEGLRMVLWLRRTDLTELRAALAADEEAER